MPNSLDSSSQPPRGAVVLLPCHALEDLPRDRPPSDAGALLKAWSVLWHPQIIALSGQMPTWHPIETPPDELSNLSIVLAASDQSKLPARLSVRKTPNPDCRIIAIEGETRREIAEEILSAPVRSSERIEDFYALAYAYLQVQLMTRHLRYSSNLDDDYFTEQLLAATSAWDRDEDAECTNALHNCFDLLAQERDHAFASDPYLVDLTLLADTTLGENLHTAISSGCPTNVLSNVHLLERMQERYPETLQALREKVQRGEIGLAGGTIDDATALDLMTLASAVDYLREARDRYVELLGKPPSAFGRFTGGLPGDLPVLLGQLDYEGAIFADFASGSNVSQDEAKLMWQSGDAEVQAICSTPLDASDPNTFLDLGPRLGEAIDAGQIATAMLVHWPGDECFAYNDLRRVAGWGLALGKFQSLDQYFDESERPYHSFSPGAGTDGGDWLDQIVAAKTIDPLSIQASQSRSQIRLETASAIAELTAIAGGTPSNDSRPTIEAASTAMAAALGITVSEHGTARAIINPHSTAKRRHVVVGGHPPDRGGHVYAGLATDDGSVAIIDTPACGFAVANPGNRPARKKLFSRDKLLASGEGLRNDFFEATLNEDTGGILSVHTTDNRSNRFSWQLVFASPDASGDKCSSMRLVRSRIAKATTSHGSICNDVEILNAAGSVVAEACLTYCLELGSRFLHIGIEIDPHCEFSDSPWHSYFGGRVAWAMEAAVPHLIVRDQIVKAAGRRLISPGGVWIDEAGPSMLVLADAMPAHRRIGRNMLDTLLIVEGERTRQFQLAYGFDVPTPVAASRAAVAPPAVLPCDVPTTADSGWLFHVDAPGVIATDWKSTNTNQQPELTVRLIETRGKSTKATLHAFRDIQVAAMVDHRGEVVRELEPSGDTVLVQLAEHQIATIRLKLA